MKIWLSLLSLLMVESIIPHAYAEQKKVLVIESYHPSLAWTLECEKSIQSTLGSYAELTFYPMDTKRIPETEFFSRADQAWSIYLDQKPDLVMLSDDNALRLLGHRFGETKTPVVYFGINNNPRNYFDKMPQNITGILEHMPVIPLLRYLKQIMPNAKNALILVDNSLTAQAVINSVFQGQDTLDIMGFHVIYRKADHWNAWQDTVKTMANTQDILLSPIFHSVRQKDGNHVSIHELISWTSAHCPVPLFTNQDYTISDDGATGAYVIQGESHARQAAEMARAILVDGKQPNQVSPKSDRKGVLFFNTKQLERFHLTLPAEISRNARFL